MNNRKIFSAVRLVAYRLSYQRKLNASSRTVLRRNGILPCVQDEFLPVYQQQLKDMIIGQVDKAGPQRDRPLEGLKVIVNAGNGMGGFLADTLAEVRKNSLC